jgi:hypothetical protein
VGEIHPALQPASSNRPPMINRKLRSIDRRTCHQEQYCIRNFRRHTSLIWRCDHTAVTLENHWIHPVHELCVPDSTWNHRITHRSLSSAYDRAVLREKPSSACLLAVYATLASKPRTAAVEQILTIAPFGSAFKSSSRLQRISFTGPLTLMAKQRFQTSLLTSPTRVWCCYCISAYRSSLL